MKNEKKKKLELGIELGAALLIFLFPYGADQIGLPHNFGVGLACWILGGAIAIRMFWIFPIWAGRLSPLEKSLIAAIMVMVFAFVFYHPVVNAYHVPRTNPNERKGEQPAAPSGGGSGTATAIVPPANAEKKNPVPNPTPKTAKAATPKQTPPVAQDCGGGNCAISVGQQGGVTAGQVLVGARTWDMFMNGQKQQEIMDILKSGQHGRVRVGWMSFDTDTMKASGGILYAFVNAGWKEDPRPNYAGSICYPTKGDCRGVQVWVHDKTSGLTTTVVKALTRLQVPVGVTEFTNNEPEDLVEILVEKP